MKKIMIIAALVAASCTTVFGEEEKVAVITETVVSNVTTVCTNYVPKTDYMVSQVKAGVDAGLKNPETKTATVDFVLKHSSTVAAKIISNNCWYKALNGREATIIELDKQLVEEVIKNTEGQAKLMATIQWIDNYSK